MPVAKSHGEAIVVDDYVFVVGGRYAVLGGTPATSDVFSSQIQADGTLGSWQRRANLPLARTNFELARIGDYLVLTGGANGGPGDDMVLTAQVRFATD